MTVHIENKNRSPSEGGFFLRFFMLDIVCGKHECLRFNEHQQMTFISVKRKTAATTDST